MNAKTSLIDVEVRAPAGGASAAAESPPLEDAATPAAGASSRPDAWVLGRR